MGKTMTSDAKLVEELRVAESACARAADESTDAVLNAHEMALVAQLLGQAAAALAEARAEIERLQRGITSRGDDMIVPAVLLDEINAAGAAAVARAEAAESELAAVRETLRGIAEANYREWDDGVNTPFAFVEWAKSRARNALVPIDALEAGSG